MGKATLLGVLVCGALTAAAHGQTMYKCGTTYSQQPCEPGASEVPVPGVGPKVRDDPGRTARMIELCKIVLRVQLKDPDSAKFEDSFRGDTTPLPMPYGQTMAVRNYWLRVNAKNSYGGYEGAHTYRCAVDLGETKVISVTR